MTILIPALCVCALAAGLSQLAVIGLSSKKGTKLRTETFYLADSGVAIGKARVRRAGNAAVGVTTIDSIAGGTIEIEIATLSEGVFRVRSTGTIGETEETVEALLKLHDGFVPGGAVDMTLDLGAALAIDGASVTLLGSASISGMDHAADGFRFADQRDAIHGVAMNRVPGEVGLFTRIAPGATLEGVPDATTERADDRSATLDAVRRFARTNSDERIHGSRVLGDADTGSFGSPDEPVLVYAWLGPRDSLVLEEGFTGHGTLIVEVIAPGSESALVMRHSASWHGPILVHVDGQSGAGESRVRLENDARIVGALLLHVNGAQTATRGSAHLVEARDGAAILFSHDRVTTARGFAAAAPQTVSVLSYGIR